PFEYVGTFRAYDPRNMPCTGDYSGDRQALLCSVPLRVIVERAVVGKDWSITAYVPLSRPVVAPGAAPSPVKVDIDEKALLAALKHIDYEAAFADGRPLPKLEEERPFLAYFASLHGTILQQRIKVPLVDRDVPADRVLWLLSLLTAAIFV